MHVHVHVSKNLFVLNCVGLKHSWNQRKHKNKYLHCWIWNKQIRHNFGMIKYFVSSYICSTFSDQRVS